MSEKQRASNMRRNRLGVVGLTVAFALALTLFPATASAQDASCTPDPSWNEPVDAAASELLVLVNAHRAALGLGPLEVSPDLVAAAEWKAAHMAATGHFAHDDPHRTWSQRIEDCGYSALATENIGWGYATALDALTGWLTSGGHREHIEDPDAVVTGIAMVTNDAGVAQWVQVFGSAVEDNGTIDDGTGSGDPVDGSSVPAAGTEAPTSPATEPADAGGSATGPAPEGTWIRRGPSALRNSDARIERRR